MLSEDLAPGDIVYAATNIFNDGTVPGVSDEAILASESQRGVIINTGYMADSPKNVVILVRFETDSELGPAVACSPEELQILAEQ